MDVQALLELKLINYDEFEAYVLFNNSEMGRNWLDKTMKIAFMDEPSPDMVTGVVFAYLSGRGSFIRNIISAIDKVNQLLKDTPNHDGSNTE